MLSKILIQNSCIFNSPTEIANPSLVLCVAIDFMCMILYTCFCLSVLWATNLIEDWNDPKVGNLMAGFFCLILFLWFLASLICVYCNSKFNYWKLQGIRGPDPVVPFGHIFHISSHPNTIFREWQDKYGSIYGIYEDLYEMRCKASLVVADAQIVKEILTGDNFCDRPACGRRLLIDSVYDINGPEWQHDRSLVAPLFTEEKMKLMFSLMQSCFKHLDNELKWYSSSGSFFNRMELFKRFVIMSTTRCLISTEIESVNKEDLAKQSATSSSSPIPHTLVGLLKRSIRTRKGNVESKKYKDLLQLLLDTQDGSDGLSDGKIINNCLLFFLEGLTRSAVTLSNMAHFLTSNPKVQEKLFLEIKSAVASTGSLKYETLCKLNYLDAVVSETNRLRAIPYVIRLCKSNCQLSNGIKLQEGQKIYIPIQAIHMNEKYHPEAEKFNPSRFLPENKKRIIPFTFLPFGDGTRCCIGKQFALLQVKLAIAQIVLKYKFQTVHSSLGKGQRLPTIVARD